MIFRGSQDYRVGILYLLLQSLRTFRLRVDAWEREMIVAGLIRCTLSLGSFLSSSTTRAEAMLV